MSLAPDRKWWLFAVLCLIWGSSFVLMKLGMFDNAGKPLLSAWQVAALRIASAGLVLLPFVPAALRRVPRRLLLPVFASGLLGSFLPAFLFCLAETRIDSGLAGTLNATTPLFTILLGWWVFGKRFPAAQVAGIALGLAGCLMLFLVRGGTPSGDWRYALLVLLATLCYALNVHMVRHFLRGQHPLDIASLAFAVLILPSMLVLATTGYFSLPLTNTDWLLGSLAAIVLGAVGTALASILFYDLLRIAGAIFASLVTYGIPFVALGWGLWYGETVSAWQMASLLLILTGVYLANRQQ